MEDPNPYAAPSSNLESGDSFGQNEGVTRGVVAELSGTKGWTRFVGVLVALVGILMLFAALGSSFWLSRSQSLPGLPFARFTGALLTAFFVILGLLGLTYGILLSGFSSAVNRLIATGDEQDLAHALRKQKAFWVFWGVVSLLGSVLSLFGLLS